MSEYKFQPLTREERDALPAADRMAYDFAAADLIKETMAAQFGEMKKGVTERAAKIVDTLTNGPHRLIDRALDALERAFHGPNGPA